MKNDPEYVDWCMSVTAPGHSLKDFVEYVKEQQLQQEDASKKRPREDAGDGLKGICVLCATSPFSAAFIPCGHTCTCYECAITLAAVYTPIYIRRCDSNAFCHA